MANSPRKKRKMNLRVAHGEFVAANWINEEGDFLSEKLVFNAVVKEVYSEVPKSQLLAMQGSDEITRETPIFGAKLLLATLQTRNRNGHRLLLPEVKKAIASMGDRLNIPGNYNHETTPVATSTKIWIENEGTNPELWLEAVVWNRCLTDDVFNDTITAFRNGTLGASFEIDNYKLQAAEDIDDTQDVLDHTLDGWALTLGVEPADQATKGRVSITATSDKQEDEPVKPKEKIILKKMELVARDNMIRVWVSELALGFLSDIPCPECDSRWSTLKKADFENGVFEMECDGDVDSDEHHRFEVKITVKSKSKGAVEATVVGGNMNPDGGVELGYRVIPSKEVDELSKEYTDEELAKIVADAKAEAITEKDKEAAEAAQREADLQAKVDEVTAKAEKDQAEAVAKAELDAVEKYKASQIAIAKRIDELHTILPYESEEAKVEARATVEAMSDVEYAAHKGDREKDKQIAELAAQLAVAKGGEPIVATTTSLPAGNVSTSAPKANTSDPFEAFRSV